MAKALKALARQVVRLLELRRALAELETLAQAQQERQQQLEATQKRLDQVILELAQQTMTDSLTGLKNRRAFDQILKEDSSRMVRTHSSLALILLDIDDFKAFNDEFGHVSGDEALQQLARVLQSQARAYDRVARYGGEEFAIVLPDTSMAEALCMAERIRQEVQDADWPHRPVTVSLGVAVASTAADCLSLVARADKVLYQAKETGRNCVVCDNSVA
jgi:diguanylate cyclase (GGDEF)-like protein